MNTKVYWNIGLVLDILHIPLAIAVLMFGPLWLPGIVHLVIASVVVVLQVALLGCPLMVLTTWLRQKHDPEYRLYGSLTHWLYNRFGPAIGIPIFLSFFSAAVIYKIFV